LEKDKSLAVARIRTPDRPAGSLVLILTMVCMHGK